MDMVTLEVFLRTTTVGIELLLAWLFWKRGSGIDIWRIGMLFLLGTSAYVLVGSPVTGQHLGLTSQPLIFLATVNSVFFWWFATALFDDDFKWRFWRFLPFFGMCCIFTARHIFPEFQSGSLDNIIQQMIVIPLMLHALWLAIAHRHDDLVEYRRHFRLVFAVMVGLMGLTIAIVEVMFELDNPPVALSLSHAVGLFALTFGLGAWILQVKPLLSAPLNETQSTQDISPQDALEIQKLKSLMETGYYREEGLTIRKLAEELGIPEHRLRRLINQELGFRNFSTYLSTYRIEEAKTMLSDPEIARRQIIQIAFDLGYGSIAPFNRAFKDLVGQTPTAYRTARLGSKLEHNHE